MTLRWYKNYCYERRCYVRQADATERIYRHPTNKFVAGFIEPEANFGGNDGDRKERSGLSGGRRRSYSSCKRRTKWCFALIGKMVILGLATGDLQDGNNRFRTSDLLRRENQLKAFVDLRER